MISCFWIQGNEDQRLLDRSRTVVAQLENLLLSIRSMESGVRGFINTGDRDFLRPFFRGEAQVPILENLLEPLLASDEPQLHIVFSRLKEAMAAKVEWDRQIVSIYEQSGAHSAVAVASTRRGLVLMKYVRTLVEAMESVENVNASQRVSELRYSKMNLSFAIFILSMLGSVFLWRTLSLESQSTRLKQEGAVAHQQLEKLHFDLKTQFLEVLKARDEANKALLIRSEFMANMSHELRTPLAGVIVSTELVLDTPLQEEQRELVQMAKHSGEELLSLIDNILEASKLETLQLDLRLEQVDLRSSIETALQPYRLKAQSKELELTLSISDSIPEILHCDSIRVIEILTNLVDNAIKFTEKGRVSIAYMLECPSVDQTFLCFSVSDTGIGISQADLSRVFDSFVQVDGSMKRRFGGVGLGLSTSKKLAELMGGTIRVSSTLRCGSEFYVTLPLKVCGSHLVLE